MQSPADLQPLDTRRLSPASSSRFTRPEVYGSESLWGLTLVRRVAVVAFLFSAELAAVTIALDNDLLAGRGGLTALIRDWGPVILRGIVAFAGIFSTFACLAFQPQLAAISRTMPVKPVRRSLLAAHAGALVLFSTLSAILYRGASGAPAGFLAFAWLAAGLFAIGSGITAWVPLRVWAGLRRSTGNLWVMALGAAAVAALAGDLFRLLWPAATHATFFIVQSLLRPLGSFSADPAHAIIGGSRFQVEIAPACSGLEGVGLIVVFTVGWLTLFRRECRFPQALLLVPAGAVLSFLLNSVRIAALVLLGSAGFQGIAAGGFHSQAGWIAFNILALCICMAARNVPWLSNTKRAASRAPGTAAASANTVSPWLLPFLSILAAGMASRALSAGFEWLYGLRFLLAVSALWWLRERYKRIDWRCDWTSPAAGLLVFLFWIALDRSPGAAMPVELAAATPAVMYVWIGFRVLGAVLTVPMAEELAFRGFLFRRLISADFESVPWTGFSWFALAGSSVLFGALHGSRWIAGALAGAVYALTMLRRGRFANAVVAHATTNALIAIDVLVFHRWNLW